MDQHPPVMTLLELKLLFQVLTKAFSRHIMALASFKAGKETERCPLNPVIGISLCDTISQIYVEMYVANHDQRQWPDLMDFQAKLEAIVGKVEPGWEPKQFIAGPLSRMPVITKKSTKSPKTVWMYSRTGVSNRINLIERCIEYLKQHYPAYIPKE
jgi:hypothetical protein